MSVYACMHIKKSCERIDTTVNIDYSSWDGLEMKEVKVSYKEETQAKRDRDRGKAGGKAYF